MASRRMIFCSRLSLEFICEGTAMAFGLLLPQLTTHLRSSSAVTGFLVSLHTSLWYIAAPFAQFLLDHCTRHRLLTTVCGLLAGMCIVVTAFTNNIAMFGFFIILSALFACVLHRQVLLLLHQYFPSNFASISTATFFGAVLGGLILPQMASLCLMAYGVEGALLVLGGVNMNLLAAGYALIVLEPPEPDQHGGEHSSDHNSADECLDAAELGELSGNVHLENTIDNGKATNCWKNDHSNNKSCSDDSNDTCDLIHRNDTASDDRDQRLGEVETNFSLFIRRLKELVRVDFIINNPLFTCTFVPSFGLIHILIGGSDFFEVSYGLAQGLEPRSAFYIPVSSVSGCAISQIICTILLEYRPTYCVGIFLASCCLSTMGFFLITLYSSLWYVLVMSFVVGFGINGTIITAEGATDAVVAEEDFADATTLSDLTAGLGFLLSGLVAGSIKDITGSMKIVFWSLGAMNLIACVLTTVLVYKKTR